MKYNEQDRRTSKTLEAIHDALYSLMSEKEYSKITIQNIIDRANVGRSTFYSHFTTKDELLLDSIDFLLQMLNEYIKNYFEKEGDESRLFHVAELFEHIKQNSRIMKGLFRSQTIDMIFEKVQTNWNIKIEEYLNSRLPKGKETKVPIAVLSNHISSTLICMFKWWVNNKMNYSPMHMEQYFEELINPCIQSIMSE